MKFNLKFNLIYLFVIAFLLTNCAEENPLLVSPKSQVGTIYVRFMNLAKDKADRVFSYDNKTDLPSIPFGFASNASNPPTDSAYLFVKKNNEIEKKTFRKIKFSSNTNYTFVAIPSNPRDSIQKVVDSIYTLQTSITRPLNSLNSYIRLCNLNPDTTVSYSLVLGCPSGISIASNLPYRGLSSHTEVRSGKVTFTLLKSALNVSENLGLFEVTLEALKDYTFIIRDDFSGQSINILDEFKNDQTALSFPKKLDSKIARIRLVNYSSTSINVFNSDSSELFNDAISSKVSDFKDISACNIAGRDTFNIFESNKATLSSMVDYSLDVNRDYSIFTFDSTLNKKAGKSIFVPPYQLDKQYNGKAIIRVVNANYMLDGINLSLGARQDNSNTILKYISGEPITSNLAYGKVSDAIALNPGVAPITVFTSSPPAKYVFSLSYTFEPNKSYVISVYNNDDGSCAISVFEESLTNSILNKSDEGVFIQFVNAVPNKEVVFSMSPILDNVNLGYSSYIATVVKKGVSSAIINGKEVKIDAKGDKRLLYVASGEENNIEINEFGLPFLGSYSDSYNSRIINTAKDLPSVSVFNNDPEKNAPYAENINYGFACPSLSIRSEQKLAYIFLNPADIKKVFYQTDDIKMTFGKTYSIILAGKSNGSTDVRKSGYTTIILQEY
jgi:hypothetical protein